MARGRLPVARLELHQPGHAVQSMPLAMKTVTQRMTWCLLALTFLVPGGLLWAHYHPLKGDVPREMKGAVGSDQPGVGPLHPLPPPGLPGGGPGRQGMPPPPGARGG